MFNIYKRFIAFKYYKTREWHAYEGGRERIYAYQHQRQSIEMGDRLRHLNTIQQLESRTIPISTADINANNRKRRWEKRRCGATKKGTRQRQPSNQIKNVDDRDGWNEPDRQPFNFSGTHIPYLLFFLFFYLYFITPTQKNLPPQPMRLPRGDSPSPRWTKASLS